jgi:hypothetical protein
VSTAKIEIEPDLDNALQSLHATECRVEITRSRPNCWRVNVTEPDGTLHEIILSADGEISATILTD